MTLIEKIKCAGLFVPRSITLAITTVCNLHCGHCLVSASSPGDSGDAVPLADLRQLIREFIEMGAEEVCLTGGDPLTHPDWMEAVRFCCRQPQLQSVCLQTNGTLINDRVARDLAAAEFQKVTFQISLDGATPQSHDFVRGEGSFQRVLKGLLSLLEAGLGERTTIFFTEMRHNMEEVAPLLEIARGLGIGAVEGGTLIKTGRAGDSEHLDLPSPEQYLALVEHYETDPMFRKRYEEMGRFSAIEWMKGRSHTRTGGCRLLEKPYVTVSGDIFPCALLQDERYAGKGVYEHALTEVLDTTLGLWEKLALASQNRARTLRCLETCPGGEHCAGGCIARAVAGEAGIGDREDRCRLRHAIYNRGAA